MYDNGCNRFGRNVFNLCRQPVQIALDRCDCVVDGRKIKPIRRNRPGRDIRTRDVDPARCSQHFGGDRTFNRYVADDLISLRYRVEIDTILPRAVHLLLHGEDVAVCNQAGNGRTVCHVFADESLRTVDPVAVVGLCRGHIARGFEVTRSLVRVFIVCRVLILQREVCGIGHVQTDIRRRIKDVIRLSFIIQREEIAKLQKRINKRPVERVRLIRYTGNHCQRTVDNRGISRSYVQQSF